MPKAINIFPALRAEMARREIDVKDIADQIGIHRITAGQKLAGRYEFTLTEALKIGELFQKIFFKRRPDL